MCKPHIRQCPACGFVRPFAWTNCKQWRATERRYCRLGQRMPFSPEDCSELEKSRDIWLFPYPALQCGNSECPTLPYREQVQDRCYMIAAEKKRRAEEALRKEREEKERQVAIFAAKWFKKIKVLSIPEQEQAWEEMMVRKEKASAKVMTKGV